jgi:hypothetical protein
MDARNMEAEVRIPRLEVSLSFAVVRTSQLCNRIYVRLLNSSAIG